MRSGKRVLLRKWQINPKAIDKCSKNSCKQANDSMTMIKSIKEDRFNADSMIKKRMRCRLKK